MQELYTDELTMDTQENISSETSKWRRMMWYVLGGLMLSCVSFNVLGLGYVLPMVGLVLQWIGFRQLQRETIWFRVCWVLTSARIVFAVVNLSLYATIWHTVIMQSPIYVAAAWGNAILMFAIVVCFWLGMREIRSRLPELIVNRAAGYLVVWYAVFVLLGIMQYSGFLPLVMIVLYLVIFYKLFRLSAQIDEMGYTVQDVPVRVPDVWFAGITCMILALGIGCGYVFFDQYPMEWRTMSAEEQSAKEHDTVYAHLKSLGVEEYVLRDLSAEDLQQCKDAIRVHTQKEHEIAGWNASNKLVTLHATHVAVELPSENDNVKWRIIHHFQWSEPLECYGTECMKLWPTYVDHNNRPAWGKIGEMTGQVLYQADGESYCAPYYSIDTEQYQTVDFFRGQQVRNDVFARFSYPAGGEQYRGYVTYATEQHDHMYIDSWMNYAHQTTKVQYPVQSAADYLKASSFRSDGAFSYHQKALQLYLPELDEAKTES